MDASPYYLGAHNLEKGAGSKQMEQTASTRSKALLGPYRVVLRIYCTAHRRKQILGIQMARSGFVERLMLAFTQYHSPVMPNKTKN